MRIEFHKLGMFAIWLMLLANRGFAQSAPVFRGESIPNDTPSAVMASESPLGQAVPSEISTECIPCLSVAPGNDGITVSMLDGKSQLKIFWLTIGFNHL